MEEFTWVNEWYLVIGSIGAGLVWAVKIKERVADLQKDLEILQSRATYVETTKLRAQVDMMEKQITGLWNYCNELRNRQNGNH